MLTWAGPREPRAELTAPWAVTSPVLLGPASSWFSFASAEVSAARDWASWETTVVVSRAASTVPAGTCWPACTATVATCPTVPKSRSVSLAGCSVPVTSTVWVTVSSCAGAVRNCAGGAPRRATSTTIRAMSRSAAAEIIQGRRRTRAI
jgi:hypothetical protein